MNAREVQVMSNQVRFHGPYNPNDGHGPGVPLPKELHEYLLSLDGKSERLDFVMERLEMQFPHFEASDHGDYIGLKHQPTGGAYPVHHWLAISYEPVSPPAPPRD